MNDQVPTYEELKRRLASAEGALKALRDGQVDTIAGEHGTLVVRLAEAEARTDHIRQILQTVRNVNQLIISEDDPKQLIERACCSLTRTTGYYNAWIVLLRDGCGVATAVASSGLNESFNLLDKQFRAGTYTHCMGRALDQDEIIVVEDPAAECANCSMSADHRGRSGLSRRLHYGGKIYGILSVSVPSTYAYDQEALSLFEEVAGNLAFALRKIEAAKELSDNQIDLKRAQSLAQLGSWRFDLKTGKITASEEARNIYGVGKTELTIETIQAAPLPQYREYLDIRLKNLIAKGTPYDVEFQIRRPSDDAIHHIHSIAEYDAERDIVLGTIQDITTRKRIEEALQESEERNRLLSDVTMEGILVHKDGIAIDLNSSLAVMLGYNREELLNINFMQIIHEDDHAIVRRNMAKEYAPPYVIRIAKKNGQHLFVEIESRNLKKQDEVLRVSAVRDITDRRQAEDEKNTLQEQLLQSQKMESIGRLAGGVAHDFNNMLGVILGYSEIAMEQVAEGHPILPILYEIQKAAQRSADLTKQLLAFARKQAAAPKVLDLNKTIESMLAMLRRLIGEDIDLIWLPGKGLGLIKMDPSQIDQILANLCVNSRDSIGNTGKITIETANLVADETFCAGHTDIGPGKYVQLTFTDNGSGMEPEVLSHLFEPFFTTKNLGQGTGLGLAMIYGIIKQNHGAVSVDSKPGLGTIFRIYLPLYETQADLAQIDSNIAQEAGCETILLVEDEPMILEMTTLLLKRLGYNILPAATPAEAIRLAEEHAGEVQMLMTDVIMPAMNGRDLARKLSSLHPKIKRLFMSGYTANVIAQHGVLEEGMHFIQKPFSIKELSAKVREVLAQGN